MALLEGTVRTKPLRAMTPAQLRTVSKADMRRAELTAALRQYVDDFDALTSKRNSIQGRIFAAAYEWVSLSITDASVLNVKAGCVRLGGTLKRSYKCIESWYYCGSYMAENALDPERHDARSIRAVYMRRAALTKAEQLKALDLIRKQADYRKVASVVENSASAGCVAAERKANELAKAGKLTRARLRMEMMAVRTLAVKLLGRSDLRVEVVRENGEVEETV